MSLLSRALVTIGLISLIHAAYSAHESSVLLSQSRIHASATSSTSIKSSPVSLTVPVDILIETIVSLVLSITGLILSSDPLKPITWGVWAGQIEKNRLLRKMGQKTTEDNARVNPFQGLEERIGFLDIRAKRREFREWKEAKDREGGKS